jgi:hypothetical protein
MPARRLVQIFVLIAHQINSDKAPGHQEDLNPYLNTPPLPPSKPSPPPPDTHARQLSSTHENTHTRIPTHPHTHTHCNKR